MIKPRSTSKLYLFGILLFGITSGAALNVVIFTVPYQLIEAGYSLGAIGAIFLTGLPYCLKPIWAPFVDRYSIAFLCTTLGQRRGWALTTQTALSLSTSMLFVISPPEDLRITACLVCAIAFFASIQDIILDAYRIERPQSSEELSVATTFSAIGLRLGMLASSAGALFLSYTFGWNFAYIGAFIMTLIGPITILFMQEPEVKEKRHVSEQFMSLKQYFTTLSDSLSLLKSNQPRWLLLVLSILLYKVSDSVPMAMSSAFFIDLSFTSYEIAAISKSYGLVVMMIGCTLSGYLSSKIGIKRSFLICGIVQLLSPISLMLLAILGHNVPVFVTVVTIQNFASGLGGTALYIYFSSLCNSEFVATQFSILSSFNTLSRILLSALAGFMATSMNWLEFFLVVSVLGASFVIVLSRVNKES